MKRLSTIEFYRQYFVATQSASAGGLARLTAAQKLEMLENLMQWNAHAETEESRDLPTQV